MNSQSLPPYWDAPSIPTCPLRCLESFDSDEAMVNVDLFLDALRGEMLGQQVAFSWGLSPENMGFQLQSSTIQKGIPRRMERCSLFLLT